MKRILPIILVVAILLTMAGCSCGKISDDPGVAPDVSAPEAVDPTPTPIVYHDPLTGEVTETDISSLRPYAFMINNIVYAQPHCGTGSAALIYEILAEGDITRFEAIFSHLDGVGAIGSMRSARPYYIEVALSYDALFVHAGGSEQAYSDIASKGVNDMDGVRGMDFTNGYFYRDPNRQQYGIEHSMFTTGEKVVAHTADCGYPATHDANYDYGLTFTDTDKMTAGGEAASTVKVSFSGLKTTNFTYQPDAANYTAEQFGSTYVDGNTGEAVTFKNVVVLFAETQIIDDYGRRSVDLDGTGDGYFCSNGKYVPITWKHGGTGTKWSYYLEDGTPLDFSVGRSYIGIVSTDSTITIA